MRLLFLLFAFLAPLFISASHPLVSSGLWKPVTHTAAQLSSVKASLKEQTFQIFLTPSNVSTLPDLIKSVSYPTSPSYGAYFSLEQLAQVVAPSTQAIQTVQTWLENIKASSIEWIPTKDAVIVTAPAELIEKELQVELKLFKNTNSKGQTKVVRRSEEPYTIPAHLTEYIQLIRGISDFPLPKEGKKFVPPTNKTPVHTSVTSKTSSSKTNPSDYTAPLFISGSSRGGRNITVKYTPVCPDGNPAIYMPPCSYINGISAFHLSATPFLDTMKDRRTISSVADTTTCSIPYGPFGTQVICEGVIQNVEYYVPYTVSVETIYGNQAVSATAANVFPIVSTPAVVPRTLWNHYDYQGTPFAVNATELGNSQCVVEFEQQYYAESDLQQFFKVMGLPIPQTPVQVIGPNDQNNDGGEAELDIQWIMAMAPNVPTVFWSIYANSSVEIDDILSWAVAVSQTANPPLVNSLSYGMTERNVDTYLGQGYLNRSDYEFMKLALRGLTIIIADGDTGAGDLGAPPMSYPNCDKMNPDWPSQSPYVTAVGSTYLTPLADPVCYLPAAQGGVDCSGNPLGEVTVSMDHGLPWTTGGGFALSVPTPDYQAQVVETYLRNYPDHTPMGLFNPNGRAYPDVVTVGHNLMTYVGMVNTPIDGTSASAPIFAGMVAWLNNKRLQANLPPLGFINPLLYYLSAYDSTAFNDITVGNNRCGSYGFAPTCCTQAFTAAPGWDAVSGLGSPNIKVLEQLVLKDFRKME